MTVTSGDEQRASSHTCGHSTKEDGADAEFPVYGAQPAKANPPARHRSMSRFLITSTYEESRRSALRKIVLTTSTAPQGPATHIGQK